MRRHGDPRRPAVIRRSERRRVDELTAGLRLAAPGRALAARAPARPPFPRAAKPPPSHAAPVASAAGGGRCAGTPLCAASQPTRSARMAVVVRADFAAQFGPAFRASLIIGYYTPG